jgi:hypothetical protein
MPEAENVEMPRAPEPAMLTRQPPAEPATARALWPTFMRRTLSEDLLRRADEGAGRA